MSKTVLSYVSLALGSIVSAVFIILAMSTGKYGMDTVKSAMLQTQQAISVVDSDFNEVQSENLPGNSVATLIQKFDGSGYRHLVVTTGCPQGYYGADGLNDVHSYSYINPKKSFKGSVVTDKNDTIYAVKFVENGLDDVEFNNDIAAKVSKSIDSQVQDEQYTLFKKFLKNRGKCNSYLQWCSVYADKLIELNDAQMRHIYTKYSGDTGNQEEYLAYQVLAYDMQLDFYNAVKEMVEVWTKGKWFEAILSAEMDSSSETLPEYKPDENDPGNNTPWWDTEEPDPDRVVDPDGASVDSDSDASQNGTDFDGDAIQWTPAPSDEPGSSEEPTAVPSMKSTAKPAESTATPTDVPAGTTEPAEIPMESEPPDGGTVEIRGPDD